MRPDLAGAVAVLLLSLTTACSGSSGAEAQPLPSPSASPAAAPSASPSSPPSASPISSPVVEAPTLVLEPDGLGVLVGASSIRHMPFETTTATQVTQAVEAALGTGKAQSLPECGQGPRRSYSVKGFDVLLDGTRFVGWFDGGAAGRSLTTADGVGIGITLAKLKALRPKVQVTEDTLGPEFGEEPTGISGFLDGTASTSRVTKVYAGESCFFR